MALTPKQEHFCQCVVSGMSYKDSYLTAYDTNCTDRTALNEASKLALREDIQNRIKTLSEPVQKAAQVKALNAREEQIAFIRERIAICKQKEDEASIIRYTDMLNKINALYKDTEAEQKQESSVVKLDMDTLKKLSGAS